MRGSAVQRGVLVDRRGFASNRLVEARASAHNWIAIYGLAIERGGRRKARRCGAGTRAIRTRGGA